jgi:hypothetical protein
MDLDNGGLGCTDCALFLNGFCISLFSGYKKGWLEAQVASNQGA